jgi:excisionase family DNA binding protein
VHDRARVPLAPASTASLEANAQAFAQEPQNDQDAPATPAATPSAATGRPPPISADPPPILTIEELAAYLRLNHKTIRDAIGRGDIPGVRRFGGAVRIHRDTVVSWLASGQGRVVGSRRTR